MSASIIVAVLMGQSAVGLYYLVEKRAKGDMLVFRLPFLLSLTFAAFLLLGEAREPGLPAAFLGVLWAVFASAFAYRRNPRVRALTDKIIACCRDW